MESLFTLHFDDMLPLMKQKLLLGSEGAQRTIELVLSYLKNEDVFARDIIVGKLVKFDVISVACDVMQTSESNFVKVVLECLEFASLHKKFYENHVAMNVVESMLRLTYCVNKSLKGSMLFKMLVQSVCNILVRSSELNVDFDDVCVWQHIVLFVKNLDVCQSQQDKLKFTAVTMLNVVLQRANFDEGADEEIIIDVCHDALKSMTEIAKYSEDDNNIFLATVILCGTCSGGSRFCCADCTQQDQTEDVLIICQKKTKLSISICDATMTIIIPYVKDADLSRIDSVAFHRNLVSCLKNLYQLKSCNHDNLSNHLAANGYLKYFLRLTVQLPENLRRSICILLSRILDILGKTAFSTDAIKYTNVLRQGLFELPKDANQWNNVIARHEKAGTALVILLYYHFHGTRENDVASLESLIARIMLLTTSVSVSILKPLWLLFAVTSISHPCPSSVDNYEKAVAQLIKILHKRQASDFYTHHIDLLRHCLACPEIPQYVLNQVLDLWMIESDGDIKPLLPFDCDKVVHRLLFVIQNGCPQHVMNLATKALRHLIQPGNHYVQKITDIVWHMLPNILSSYELNGNVAHIEAVLELANIIQPHTMPIHLVTRSADNIINIILKETTNLKFITAVIKQAYIFLVFAESQKLCKVPKSYINAELLKNLYVYGLSKERPELSSISLKLLALIVHCLKKFPIECEQFLIVYVENLVELLMHAMKSQYCLVHGIQFIFELFTQNDGTAVVLQKIATDIDVRMVINLYECLHIAYFAVDIKLIPESRDTVYQCLMALLDFCNDKVTCNNALLPHLCNSMSNYNLVLDFAKTGHVSRHFVKFVVTWLQHYKTNCNYKPWKPAFFFKLRFDEVLDHLREYATMVNTKGPKDVYLELKRALLQFSSKQ